MHFNTFFASLGTVAAVLVPSARASVTSIVGYESVPPPVASSTRASAPATSPTSVIGPHADGKYWVSSNGIKASFIPYGASISNLIVRDQYGIERDLVGGFDNASYYSIDRQHPHFGSVPGRYANRIKNSSFEIDGTTYHIKPNENPTPSHPNGIDTLHGGPHGWDWRNFTVVSHTPNSITFSLLDKDGDQGFPGDVLSTITYTMGDHEWNFVMTATPLNKKTPIMLSSHTYWNLDGYANNETNLALNHSLYLPYSGQRVATDNILIPTGDILANQPGSLNDFWTKPKEIGANFTNPALLGNCGFNCTGYDTCFLVNRQEGTYDWRADGGFIARMQSPWSGIQLDVYSDQDAFQVYSCGGQNGSMALKNTQGLFNEHTFPRVIPQYGCVVLEVQDWIDAINQPTWNRKQIFSPGELYTLQASYRFSINSTKTK